MKISHRIFSVLSAVIISVGLHAQTYNVHILSANDMHAKLDNMPMLSAIVDSLRAIDPYTLVLSAGDNRTGDAVNDLYSIPTYPMTSCMNFIGFDASAFGNHEFDNRQEGLSTVLATSNFPYICANFSCDPSLNIHPVPYVIFDVAGVKVGILGVVQLGTHGLPDAHPDYMKGMTFTPVEETIEKYKWLRDKVDVFVLLSHIGYEDDVVMAAKYPFFDAIVGGHSHTQLKGGELHNGVLVTQNVNKLKRVTYTTIQVVDGKVVGKEAKNIEVEGYPKKNEVVEHMVKFFQDNPMFKRQLAMAEAFNNEEELGSLMCDALVAVAGADIAIQNKGGVRYETKEAGPFTVDDVLRLDPFGNSCVEMMLTGEEFKQLFLSCAGNDYNFPYVAGVTCEITMDKNNPEAIKDIKMFTPDGKKLNPKKKYKVVTNSYVAAICDSPRQDQGHDIGMVCSDMLMKFLEDQKTVDYRGVSRLKRIK
ncbi:MAG: bifunctional metallophosphatase/5'-nucleotidase [Prevotella sp.]|nr:bifunctional metallophosphatase/5'-nucleotidase [Prevotella sp.]